MSSPTRQGHCKPSPRACADGEGRCRAAAPQELVRRPHRGDLAGLLIVGTTAVIASRPLIGVQFEGWHRGIDSIVPMREEDGEGGGKDCMRQFRAAWDRFSADPARLSEFLETKRKRLR